MTDLFTIGASGVRAYQTALATTSENIANASTAGYSRRSATIEEVGRTTSIQLGQTTKLAGNGAMVTGIARASDMFRTAETWTTGADLARTESGVVWLDRIEGALTGARLGDRLTTFFNAAKSVAADPAASAPRVVMLEAAAGVAAGFVATGRALDAARADLAGAGADTARSLSDLAQSLVRVNASLVRATDATTARASLLDERDRLIADMSELVDVDASFDQFGRATVRAGSNTGPVLADPMGAGYVSFAMNAEGATVFTVSGIGGSEAIAAHGGAIAGIADSAARIAQARETLNGIATGFVTALNDFQADGRDLDGQGGAAMFAVGATATDISLVLDDPRGIAAAAVGEGSRGNGNLAALAATRLDGRFEARLDDLVTGNAAALGARRAVAEAQGSIHDAAVAAREGVRGVDLDEEAVNLIRFQQAYQASSRVIQVAREILQTIIDIR